VSRLVASIHAFMREWRRRAWLKARRAAIKDTVPF
jgi:hypothetical protein